MANVCPIHGTKDQLHDYCLNQLHMLDPTKGTHMTFTWTLFGDLVLVVVTGVAVYEICKRGLTGTYSWVRGLFAQSTPTVTQPTTPAA